MSTQVFLWPETLFWHFQLISLVNSNISKALYARDRTKTRNQQKLVFLHCLRATSLVFFVTRLNGVVLEVLNSYFGICLCIASNFHLSIWKFRIRFIKIRLYRSRLAQCLLTCCFTIWINKNKLRLFPTQNSKKPPKKYTESHKEKGLQRTYDGLRHETIKTFSKLFSNQWERDQDWKRKKCSYKSGRWTNVLWTCSSSCASWKQKNTFSMLITIKACNNPKCPWIFTLVRTNCKYLARTHSLRKKCLY